MNKLKLRLDDLRIESFRTAPANEQKGTVRGKEGTCVDYGTCCYSCGPTCHGSCPPGTCNQSCPVEDTCYMAAC